MAESSIIASCSIIEQILVFRKGFVMAESSIIAYCIILEQIMPLRKALSWQ